ncbi:hypothetical protein SLE2022_370820 [Rubroshorea leprosula]
MDNKRKICKICNRAFANGKAMGGHMRSHLAKHPAPPKPNPTPLPTPDYPTRSSPISPFYSSSETSPPEKSDLADGESDTESSPKTSTNLTRTRSKRRPKFVVNAVQVQLSSAHPEPESVNSFSEAFPDDEVAMCLLKLKRDKWSKEFKKEVIKRGREEENDQQEEDENVSFLVTSARSAKSQYKYKCRICKKRFRSHQALGGHKASHKNSKKYDPDEGESGYVNGYMNQRNFECPFCDKVFESGQALGGHKKVHFSYLTVVKKIPEKSETQHSFLDLNRFPEEDEEVSQVEFSSVSNAEIMHVRGN